jgi:putative redox protein
MSVKVDVEYVGGFKTRAVHGPSASVLVTVPPVDNQGDGSSFSPTDLCATSYATCALTIFAMAAKKHGLDVTGATARVEKEMSKDLPRRIAALPLVITVPPGIPAELRPRLEAAARSCPVALSLRPELADGMTFVWREA